MSHRFGYQIKSLIKKNNFSITLLNKLKQIQNFSMYFLYATVKALWMECTLYLLCKCHDIVSVEILITIWGLSLTVLILQSPTARLYSIKIAFTVLKFWIISCNFFYFFLVPSDLCSIFKHKYVKMMIKRINIDNRTVNCNANDKTMKFSFFLIVVCSFKSMLLFTTLK